jgi:hypothetical protein
MSQDFAKYRNKEEELKRVNKVKTILGTSVDVSYGLPSGICLSVPGPIVDDEKRRSIELQEWRVWYDIYKDKSFILIPYARRPDITRLFTYSTWFFIICVVGVCTRLVVLYLNKDRIML